jgi:RNA polymerase sigma-70 factor (ECF subfamily)
VSQLPDEKIMNKVKDGHLSELAELFERYHVALYNFFLKLTSDKEKSEDLTQNLFYRIIRYRDTFNTEKGTFKSWVYQMARNLHVDYCKQEKKIADIVKDSYHSPQEMAIKEEGFVEKDYEKLHVALSGLGPVDRELILLSRFEGLKYEEISKLKNMTVGSIKVQIHRAIKELKNLYFKQ